MILVKANVPGFEQEDINIEVTEDSVTIRGGKFEEYNKDDKKKKKKK